MNIDHIAKLEWHAGLAPQIETEGLRGTFVGMLRPFVQLQPRLLKEVRELVEGLLAQDLDAPARLRAVAVVLELTTLSRSWGLDPDSMLFRNRLLRDKDAEELLAWTRDLEESCKRLCEIEPAPPRGPT